MKTTRQDYVQRRTARARGASMKTTRQDYIVASLWLVVANVFFIALNPAGAGVVVNAAAAFLGLVAVLVAWRMPP